MIYKARCSSLKELMTGRARKDGSIDFGDTVKNATDNIKNSGVGKFVTGLFN